MGTKIISDRPDINLNGKITVEKDNGGNAYRTPLQIGAACGKYDIVKYLLDNHRDRLYMDAKTEVGGKTALHLAAKYDHDKVARILIDNGANKHIQEERVGTPLHRAVISESKRVVGCLIEKGVDITLKNRDSKTALELAREKDHKKIIKLIENYEIESELRNYVSEDSENFEHIKNAFEKSSYQASNPVMDSPSLLYHAAKKGWKEAVKFLVEKGEEEDLRELIRQKDDSCHLSPLYVAVQEENTEMVELLIYGRAKSNHKNLANGYERIEQEAVQGRGAAVADLRDQEGRTLLHVAAVKGHESIVKLLVEFMAIAAEQYENERRDPNDQVHQSDVMRELMYVSRKDSTDNTAESLAHSTEFTPIVDFLKEVKEGIEERRKNLDNNAKVLSTCGGGINTGILGCIGSLVSCIHGSLGVLGIQCNGAYQTQSWVHERKRLIIEARKIWRDKNNRLWQMINQ